MQTDYKFSATADIDAQDKYQTHLLITMKGFDEIDLEEAVEIFTNSVKSSNIFCSVPLLANDLSNLGIFTTVKLTSKSWTMKQTFRLMMKISNWQLKKLGRDKFIERYCSKNYA